MESDSTDAAASSPKRLTRRERLLAVADQVDKNEWRKKLRASLKDHDIAALKELAESNESEAQSPELIAWLGAVLREAEELDASITVLKEAQPNHPGDFWLNNELATSLLYSGKATEAVEFARAALAVKPNSLGSLFTLAGALGEAGRNEDYYRVHRQILPQIPLGIHDTVAMWNFGHTARRLDKLDDTIALWRGYSEAYPNDARGHILLAMALGNVQERLEDALPPLKKVIELKPNDTATYAHFTFYLGNNLTAQGKLAEAIEAYRLGIQFDPENALMWMRLAPALVLAGDEASYGEYCQEIVQHFAGTVNLLDASIVCKACLLMPDAMDLAELPRELIANGLDEGTAPEWYPPWGWNTLALLAYRSGDADAAIQHVQKSEESIPNDFAHALNLTILALAHQKLGQIDAAGKDAANAAKAIDDLRHGPARWNETLVHDVLISQVLLREAESQINAKATSQPAEGGDEEP
jgi:tetratricopeptide (TPR) repeat protein